MHAEKLHRTASDKAKYWYGGAHEPRFEKRGTENTGVLKSSAYAVPASDAALDVAPTKAPHPIPVLSLSIKKYKHNTNY